MTADAVGGVWTYALELARALGATASRPPSRRWGRARRPIASPQRRHPGLDIVCSEFQLEWMDDPWADVAQAGAGCSISRRA